MIMLTEILPLSDKLKQKYSKKELSMIAGNCCKHHEEILE